MKSNLKVIKAGDRLFKRDISPRSLGNLIGGFVSILIGTDLIRGGVIK